MIVFDTDVVSYMLRARPPAGLVRKAARLDPDAQAVTTITVGELVYGARRSRRAGRLLRSLEENLWPHVRILDFDFAAAQIYGELRAGLEAAGTPLAEPDLRIAATCLRFGAELATGNIRHFARVPGLEVSDWLAEYR